MVIVSSLYIWPLAIFSTVMFVIHSCLAVGNVTTFEVGGGADNIDYLKGTKECDLPFSKVRYWGCLRLCFWVRVFFVFLCSRLCLSLSSFCNSYLPPVGEGRRRARGSSSTVFHAVTDSPHVCLPRKP